MHISLLQYPTINLMGCLSIIFTKNMYACMNVTNFQDDHFYISRCIFIHQIFTQIYSTPRFCYQYQVPKHSFRDTYFLIDASISINIKPTFSELW